MFLDSLKFPRFLMSFLPDSVCDIAIPIINIPMEVVATGAIPVD